MNLKIIDSRLKDLAVKNNYNFTVDTQSGANQQLDHLSGKSLWLSVTEDGSLNTFPTGQLYLERHMRLMFLKPTPIEAPGEICQEAKIELLSDAVRITNRFLRDLEEKGFAEETQNPTYECGFDNFDANLAFTLVNIYLRVPYDNCNE